MALSTGPSRKIPTLKPQIEHIPFLPGQRKIVQNEKKKPKPKQNTSATLKGFVNCYRKILKQLLRFH